MDQMMRGLRFLLFLILFGTMSMGAIPAQATLVTVDFVVSRFGTGAPMDSVNGTFAYYSSSSRGAIGPIASIDLTIDGYTYSIGEIGSFTSTIVYPARDIGGIVGGVHGISLGANDFSLFMHAREVPLYRPPPIDVTYPILDLAPETFSYTTPNYPNLYSSSNFTTFNVTESLSPVPEPSTMLLLASGLVGLAGYGRRRFKK